MHAPANPAQKAPGLTPMMAQYFEIKAVNPGYLLFYRMGDFYELFFEDAETASQALGITLTKRGKHLGEDIAMCGVPVHAANDYLNRLIRLGHRVAVCEQVEDPAEARKRGGKSVVRRDVVRLVTPGTLTEDDHLDARANNFLAALSMLRHGETDFGLAWADISTGEVYVSDLGPEALADELARIAPAELLVSARAGDHLAAIALPSNVAANRIVLEETMFDSEAAAGRIRSGFGETAVDPTAFSRAGRAALGALLTYVADTQKSARMALRPPVADAPERHMRIDLATRVSLEILTTNRGESAGSLRHAIDMTVTPAGSRLLAGRLSAPLCDPDAVNRRLDMVESLVADTLSATRLRQALRGAPDMVRALTRLSLDRGGPRDLAAIGAGVERAVQLGEILSAVALPPEGLVALAEALASAPSALAADLAAALADDLPLMHRDGGFVRAGWDGTLDHYRTLGSESRQVVAALQARLVEETGVRALKIRHNGVLGFFIEVPAAHGERLRERGSAFIHRQTLANAMRFTTGELADLEGEIAKAQDAALAIELEIFAALRARVLEHAGALRGLADAVAELDVTAALAQLAAERGYVRPQIDGSMAFAVHGGRHPVVETMLGRKGTSFVANDCELSGDTALDAGQLWLVTGPNMGGKSTFLRQNALIAILAQIGAYVPAQSAHIGVVDRVFSRVGASDDIAQGRSTFMVEMVETAAILDRATRRSLVVLDEIGRGTSTFDGLSIAWACAESLHESTGCRTLFATHYHELTALSQILERVSNHTMKVREWKGEVVFLHEVVEGAADRSYGIQVARLAGLPEAVIKRARAVLAQLEKRSSGAPGSVLEDLPLFSQTTTAPQPRDNPLMDMIDSLRPDALTPLQALEMLYQLKKVRDADGTR